MPTDRRQLDAIRDQATNDRRLSVSLPPDLYDDVVAEADRRRCSIGAVVRVAIATFFLGDEVS